MSKPKLIVQQWTNSIGQLINPGDKVLSIATGFSHTTRVRQGIFLGTVNGNPSVSIEENKFGYWVNGKNIGYYKAIHLKVEGTYERRSSRTTLRSGRVYKLA